MAGLRLWMTRAAIVAAAVLGLSCAAPTRQDLANRARAENTVEAWERYVAVAADDRAAVRQLRDLRARRDWQAAREADTRAAYATFARRWYRTDAPHFEDACRKVPEVCDDLTWERIRTLPNRDDFGQLGELRAFVQERPSSHRAAEARVLLQELLEQRWARADDEHTIEGYERFVRSYPESTRVPQARERLSRFGSEQDRWAALIAAPTPQRFEAFAAADPDSPYARWARDAVAAARGQPAAGLVSRKQIGWLAKGAGIQSMDLELRNRAPYPVRVQLAAGTVLEPEFGQSAYQEMVVTRPQDLVLAPGQSRSLIAAVACLNRTKKIPGSDIRYLLSQRAPQWTTLFDPGPTGANRSRVLQAAVWILADNAGWDELGILKDLIQGSRSIGPDESAAALKLLADQGHDFRATALWRGRQVFVAQVRDAALRQWLDETGRPQQPPGR